MTTAASLPRRSFLLAARAARAVPPTGRTGAVIVWMAVIFFFSAQPDSGQQSGALLQYLAGIVGLEASGPNAEFAHHLLRKVAHFTEYAILGTLCAWALPRGAQRWVVAWACATGYAATDEIHQAFVPGRGPAVMDVMIDSLGAATACFVAAKAWVAESLTRP